MQGTGLGSKALGQALAESNAAGWSVMLSTNEERNVHFFGLTRARLGFEVVRWFGAVAIELEGIPYTTWLMVRPR